MILGYFKPGFSKQWTLWICQVYLEKNYSFKRIQILVFNRLCFSRYFVRMKMMTRWCCSSPRSLIDIYSSVLYHFSIRAKRSKAQSRRFDFFMLGKEFWVLRCPGCISWSLGQKIFGWRTACLGTIEFIAFLVYLTKSLAWTWHEMHPGLIYARKPNSLEKYT